MAEKWKEQNPIIKINHLFSNNKKDKNKTSNSHTKRTKMTFSFDSINIFGRRDKVAIVVNIATFNGDYVFIKLMNKKTEKIWNCWLFAEHFMELFTFKSSTRAIFTQKRSTPTASTFIQFSVRQKKNEKLFPFR